MQKTKNFAFQTYFSIWKSFNNLKLLKVMLIKKMKKKRQVNLCLVRKESKRRAEKE